MEPTDFNKAALVEAYKAIYLKNGLIWKSLRVSLGLPENLILGVIRKPSEVKRDTYHA